VIGGQPLRVLMTSTSYPRNAADWRGVFIRCLAQSLARHENIQLDVWAPPGELPRGARAAMLPAEGAWLSRMMDAGGISHMLRNKRAVNLFAPLVLLRMLRAVFRREDAVSVYHINWLQCALPLPDNRVPALISVLGNDMKLLRLPLMRSLLRRVMRQRKVAICPNADWMRIPLETAFGDLAPVIPVAFGVDPLWYTIQRSPSLDVPIWLAVTRLTADKLGPLFEWSAPLFQSSNRQLHLFGPMQEPTKMPDWINYHGAASPEQLAHGWFPRACGLITLSRHAEGRPQVMLEAMAAGLPIVASRMAAHAAIVVDGETGALCDSAQTYADALQTLEDAGINLRFGMAARRRAQKEIGTWDDCADGYVDIYRQLLGTATHDR
jgi:glycosyltransferase involved in cell wall biosynthesis